MSIVMIICVHGRSIYRTLCDFKILRFSLNHASELMTKMSHNILFFRNIPSICNLYWFWSINQLLLRDWWEENHGELIVLWVIYIIFIFGVKYIWNNLCFSTFSKLNLRYSTFTIYNWQNNTLLLFEHYLNTIYKSFKSNNYDTHQNIFGFYKIPVT